MANQNGKGHIDACTNGRLEGWAQTHTSSQAVTVQIDNAIFISITADKYRLDLEKAGIIDGHASFSEPLNPLLLDGNIHFVELIDSENGKRLAKAEIRFEKLEKLEKLSDSVLSCSQAKAPEAGEKIVILCGYEKTTRLSKASESLIRNLKERGFYVVFVLAVDRHRGPRHLGGCTADLTIVRNNIGYDFGSWACAFYKLRQLGLVNCQSLLLINDSIIWTGEKIDQKFFDLSQNGVSYDVVGAVESRERKRHLQSYFLNFSSQVISKYRLDEFLMYSGSLSNKKDEIISAFELASCSFFEEKGFSTFAINSYSELLSSFIGKYSEQFFQSQIIDTRYMDLNPDERCLVNWINIISSGRAVNPSHLLWREILESGFPFVKKELLFRNPANVPFYRTFHQEFTKEALESLDDSASHSLDAFFPFIQAKPEMESGAGESAAEKASLN